MSSARLTHFEYRETQETTPIYGYIGYPVPWQTGVARGPRTRTLSIEVSDPTHEQADAIRVAIEKILRGEP